MDPPAVQGYILEFFEGVYAGLVLCLFVVILYIIKKLNYMIFFDN